MQRKIAYQSSQDDSNDRPIIDVTPEPVDDVNLSDILDRLRRRWRVIVGIVGTVVVVTSGFLYVVTPSYSAKGQLLIDNRANQVTNMNSVVVGPSSDITDVPNEVEILKSSILAGLVVESLGLDKDPEYNLVLRAETMEKEPLWRRAQDTIQTSIKSFFASPKKEAAPEDEKKKSQQDEWFEQIKVDQARAHINEVFLKSLSVNSTQSTRVIDVEFDSKDPVKAAKVVNELMRTYLENQVQYQKRGMQKATERLGKIAAELKDEVIAAENAVQDYRSKSRLIEAKGTSVTAQQLAELNSRLVQARADEAAAAARLSQVSRLLKVPGSMAAAPDVLSSPTIMRLKERETDLQREMSDLTTRYGAKHPKMIKITAELRGLRSRMTDETNKVVEGLSNEVAVARAKLASLQGGLGRLENDAIDINQQEIKLRELEREAQSKRELHQTFLIRYRETSARQEMIEPVARIVSYAEPPRQPAFPKRTKTLAIATMLSTLIAIAAALVLEGLRRNFETAEEVEKVTGSRCLGVLPRTQKPMALLDGQQRLRLLNPYSRLNQAIQNIRSTLYLENESRHPKTLLITSALPREGKTTFAAWYASFCASLGQKVILIDSDFERPKIHQIMQVSNDVGLANIFADDLDLKSVIHTDAKTGISFITAGRTDVRGSQLIDSTKMQEILDTLSWDYDLIVIDSAPVLALTDAHIIAKLVDSTVFVLQWCRTRHDMAVAAARRLQSIDVTSIGGFVLSQVSPRRSAGIIGYAPYVGDDGAAETKIQRYLRRMGLRSGTERAPAAPRLEA
ncbi:MAG: AAA family ATPase [Alphaproteobacteria bacterium]|nr:AAA family ATPase [Alphaproteobacteria bacterium]